MATRDPNNPDTTVAVQASAWLDLCNAMSDARAIIDLVISYDYTIPRALYDRALAWRDEHGDRFIRFEQQEG